MPKSPPAKYYFGVPAWVWYLGTIAVVMFAGKILNNEHEREAARELIGKDGIVV